MGNEKTEEEMEKEFTYTLDEFADIRVMRYRFEAWDELSTNQKHFVYHLSQAALWGRDIIWLQNCPLNLPIRKALEAALQNWQGDRASGEWREFETYSKRVFFSNGIHHHYGEDKFFPLCGRDFFKGVILSSCGKSDAESYVEKITDWVYNPAIAPKRRESDKTKDLVAASAVGFYENVSRKEVEDFYALSPQQDKERPLSVGINSRLVKTEKGIEERVCRVGGEYSRYIEKIVSHLRAALPYSENEKQKRATELLIDYYTTGDLKTWDDYNVAWVGENEATVDYISGFIETYLDPLGRKASWEALVEVKDAVATQRCRTLAENASWFEEHSPIEERFKKSDVRGISANVVDAVCLAGDNFPSPPIGINLPNSDWIRKQFGSKSVNIANLSHAYEYAAMEKPQSVLAEFAYSKEEKSRARLHSTLANDLHTDIHACLVHGSGKLLAETGQNALREYSSCLEEARADLFALYFLLDEKLIELGLVEDLEVGREAYDSYIRVGLLSQLARVELGKSLTESHTQARQLIARYALENGDCIERKSVGGKTYFTITDYGKLKECFGELLREIQRIKSTGDYVDGKALVETYGIEIDFELHKEVLERYRALRLKPYGGFVNIEIREVKDERGETADYKLEYPDSFLAQMLQYGREYSFD